MTYRIAKYIARSGYCSRRDAEKLIFNHQVKVNGDIITTPAYWVDDRHKITIDDTPLKPHQETRLWRYHKPRGLIVTMNDEKNRNTIFEQLKKHHAIDYIISVGRLDMDSEGLMLLTNDGALARTLELPKNQWLRKYKVRAHMDNHWKSYDWQKIHDELQQGIDIDGVKYDKIDFNISKGEQRDGANQWIDVTLREGKNREIRRVFEYFDLQVNRLIRLSYGAFHLGKLTKGDIDEVSPKALKAILPNDVL